MKQELRVEETRRQFRVALLKLMEEKPVSKISIRELSEATGLNRGTFYLHYQDIYDLLDDLENYVLQQLSDILALHDPKELSHNIYPLIRDIFQQAADNRELYAAIMNSTEHTGLMDKIQALVKEKVFYDWDHIFQHPKTQNYDVYYSYLSSGLIGLLRYWVQDGTESVEEISELAKTLVISGVGVIH